jgi:hypothetical protein
VHREDGLERAVSRERLMIRVEVRRSAGDLRWLHRWRLERDFDELVTGCRRQPRERE